METIYNVDYFIAKFSAIPDRMWCIGTLHRDGTSCALGHCGVRSNTHEWVHTAESRALAIVLGISNPNDVYNINDGFLDKYQQDTPKQRILAALYDIKKAQQPEVKERIVYVMRDQAVKELTTLELIES